MSRVNIGDSSVAAEEKIQCRGYLRVSFLARFKGSADKKFDVLHCSISLVCGNDKAGQICAGKICCPSRRTYRVLEGGKEHFKEDLIELAGELRDLLNEHVGDEVFSSLPRCHQIGERKEAGKKAKSCAAARSGSCSGASAACSRSKQARKQKRKIAEMRERAGR